MLPLGGCVVRTWASGCIRTLARHRWITLIVILVMAGTSVQVPSLVAAWQRDARRPKVHKTASVHVHKLGAESGIVKPYAGPVLRTLPRPKWPKAGTATLPVTGAASTAVQHGAASAVTRVGGLPLWVAPAAALAGEQSTAAVRMARRVHVQVLDPSVARRAGLNGMLLRITRADGLADAGSVAIGLDYSAFRYAFGGDWASRLRLVSMPDCVVTTPNLPACQTGTPLPTTNDTRHGRLAATLTAADASDVRSKASPSPPVSPSASASAGVPTSSASPTTNLSEPAIPTPAPSASDTPAPRSPRPSLNSGGVIALAAAPAGSSGNYTATSLSASSTWQVDAHTGDFTWSYPIDVPPVPGGLAPKVALSYDSGSVDGRTRTTNNQPSWLGEGFEYSPGYVERTYAACADAGVPKHTVSGQSVQDGDECWKGDNLTLSLNGKSSELIKDDVTGAWHLKDDDGSKIERLTGASNGALNGEYWKLTTTEGTQYVFGLNHLPGYGSGVSATNSTWTVPVYGPKSGDPCYKTDVTQAWCQQAWRWNLDYVVNPHKNAMSLYYTAETNYYKRGYALADGATGTSTTYVRGGYLTEIDYGQQLDSKGSIYSAHALGRVVFTPAERCFSTSSFNCDTASNFTKANASHWPDVPVDQNCSSSDSCSTNIAPTFWSRKRLSTITTSVWNGSSWASTDSWIMDEKFPAVADLDSPELWLNGITHKGLRNGGNISLPEVTFTPAALPNRVLNADGSPSDNLPELYKLRLIGIKTETGAAISVVYSDRDCVWGQTPDPSSDTKRCFQQYWSPPGATSPAPDWFNKYVVTDISTSDLTGGAPPTETHYKYPADGAAWHYDESPITPDKHKSWSDWRGYSSVQTLTGAAGGIQSETDTTSMRGMDGDRATRDGKTKKSVEIQDSETTPLTDSDALEGFTREEIVRNGVGGAEVSGTINDPTPVTPTATQGGRSSYMIRIAATHKRIDLAGGGYRRTEVDTAYDKYGDPTQIDDRDLSASGDDQCTRSDFLTDTSTWMIAYPTRTLIFSGRCSDTPTYPDDVISDKKIDYDAAGNPVTTSKAASYSGSTPTYVTTAKTDYDTYGRVTKTRDAADHATTTTYTPATGIPTSQAVTNPRNQTTTTTLDVATGKPTTVLDANTPPNRTDLAYDALGRITDVWLPGRSKSGGQSASEKFSYLVRTDGAVAVGTSMLNNDGSSYLTSYQLYDGLLRKRQTQTPAPDSGRVITDTLYDSRGLAVESRPHYYNSSAPGTDLVSADDAQIPAQTYTTYDGAGRATASIYAELGTEKWRTTTTYNGDSTLVIPPQGGTVTQTYVDARGHTTDLRHYQNADLTGGHDDTTYTYTPSGQLASITDATSGSVHNVWQRKYDVRGRLIRSVDPDTGTTTNAYNDLDQLTSTTDNRGKTTSFTYDELGRKTAEYDGIDSTAPLLASWTYDTIAKGRLTSATRHTAQGDYTTRVDGYDPLGRPTSTSIVVPSVPGEEKLANTYTFTTGYNLDGTVSNTTFPATGDLSDELMRYSYDDVRLPTVTSGLDAYVLGTDYTAFGEPQQYTLATTGKWTWLTNYYEQGTRRLSERSVQRQASTSTDLDTHYTYDQAGDITTAADTPGTGATDVQCYRYDYLQRLTQAWTTGTAPTSDAPDPCATQPSSGSAITGAAPYWQSYAYDITGNRTQEIDHDTSGNAAADVTHTYDYPATGQAQPHAVQQVTAQNGLGRTTATDTYQYDAEGNTTTRDVAGDQQTLTWDDQDKLTQVNDTKTGTTGYVYDADGNLIERRDPTATTLYLPGEEVRLDKNTNTLAATRYYTHGTQTIAMRTAAGVQWLAPDQQGTADLQIDAVTEQVTERRFTPYGQPRGDASGVWGGDKGFVGGTIEPATQLTQLGAREYDPVTGRFISPDPVVNPDNPQQINGYSYAENNPATSSDPTGLCDPNGGCGTNPCHPTGGICGHEADLVGHSSDNSGGYRTPIVQISPHVYVPAFDPQLRVLQDAWKWANRHYPSASEAAKWEFICTAGPIGACTGNLPSIFGINEDQPKAAALFGAGASILLTGQDASRNAEIIVPKTVADKLQGLLDEAADKYKRGEIKLSNRQMAAIEDVPKLEKAFVGSELDNWVKRQIMASEDPELQRLFPVLRGYPGPDVIDPHAKVYGPNWYDFTTRTDWATHQADYASFGRGEGVFWDPADVIGAAGAGEGEGEGGGE